MENNYFKKGAFIAVQRLESAGNTLPPPDYGTDELINGTAESGDVRPEPTSAAQNSRGTVAKISIR